jgi:hypothetical protein
MTRGKRVAAVVSVSALMFTGVAAPIAAGSGYVPPPTNGKGKVKCNSGRGNGSEFIAPGVDCDPGRSGGVNRGGD